MGFLSDLFSGLRKNKEPVQKPVEKLPEGWAVPVNKSWSYRHEQNNSSRDGEIIAQTLKNGDIERFSLSLSSWNGREAENAIVDAFVKVLPETKIKELRLTSGSQENVAKILEALPNSKVSELDMTYIYDKASFEKLGEILPKTKLKKLSFSNEFLTDEEFKPVLDNLPPSLGTIDISGCRALTDKSVEAMLPYIGKTNLRVIDLMMTEITDKHMPELLEKARDPEVQPLSIITTWSKVSDADSLSKEFSYYKAQKEKPARNARYIANLDRKFVMEPVTGLSEARKPENLAQYAYAGRLPEVMQKGIRLGNPITAEELTTSSGEYKASALNAAAYRYDLDKVFDPKCWADAKEMQKAFDAAGSNKIQLDGKNGRPSFEERKKAVENSPVTAKIQAILAQRGRI